MKRIAFAILFFTIAATAQDYGPLANGPTVDATKFEAFRQSVADSYHLGLEHMTLILWEYATGIDGSPAKPTDLDPDTYTAILDPVQPDSLIAVLARRNAVAAIKKFRPPDRAWYQTVLDRDAATVYGEETKAVIDARKEIIEQPLEVKRERATPTPTATPSGGGR